MKKFYLLIFILILASCSEEDSPVNDLGTHETRSNFIVTTDYVDQLCTKNISVYFTISKGIAGIDEMYMSGRRDSDVVILHPNDQGRGQERYTIEKSTRNGYYRIKVQGGVFSNKHYLGDNPASNVPTLVGTTPGEQADWKLELDTSTNKYRLKGAVSGRYIKVEKYGSRYLKLEKEISKNGLSDWNIHPTGNLVYESIQYDIKRSSVLPRPDYIMEAIVVNESSVQQSMAMTYSTSATETSSFSKTTGLTKTISINRGVSIPLISDGPSLNASVTSSSTWSWSNTESKTESKTESRSYNFSISVPPKSKILAKIYVSTYDASAPYKATCRIENSNIPIEVEGIWKGIKCGEIRYEIYQVIGNKQTFVKEIYDTPTSTVVL